MGVIKVGMCGVMKLGSTGWSLPIIIAFCVAISLLISLIDKWTQPKSSYKKWLEEELEENPDYINWLKDANSGKDYKTGLRILARIKRDNNNSYKRWLKKIRKLEKW